MTNWSEGKRATGRPQSRQARFVFLPSGAEWRQRQDHSDELRGQRCDPKVSLCLGLLMDCDWASDPDSSAEWFIHQRCLRAQLCVRRLTRKLPCDILASACANASVFLWLMRDALKAKDCKFVQLQSLKSFLFMLLIVSLEAVKNVKHHYNSLQWNM